MTKLDARLRATDRGADTEERAALLARAGRYAEAHACYAVVAQALWEQLRRADQEGSLGLIDGEPLPIAEALRGSPRVHARQLAVKALRREWRRIRAAMRAVRS